MQVARDRTIRIVRYADETPSIMSPAYKIFQVIDKNILNPEFLMLYFLRPEFDRLCWFYTDSSIRGSLDWAKFCNLKVPVPPIDIQEKIVNIYNFLNERIHLKNKINKNLLQLVKTIFRMWFVEFEPFSVEEAEQKAEFFSPTDIVCSVRKYDGKKFNLLDFVDATTGFISDKSSNGRPLRAMERPGLWNGSMAGWNTIFAVVPITTFTPVKMISDLLQASHK